MDSKIKIPTDTKQKKKLQRTYQSLVNCMTATEIFDLTLQVGILFVSPFKGWGLLSLLLI